MAQVTALKALTNFFNVGASKKPMADWNAEIKELDAAEKQELAGLAAAANGDTIKPLTEA